MATLSQGTDEFSKDGMLAALVDANENQVMLSPAGCGYNVLFRHDSEVPIKAWIRGVSMEDEAQAQLLNIAALPIVHKHVAAMPDVHFGIGATVGSVIATKGAIIPAAVGVDIGCGLMTVRTGLTANDLPSGLGKLREAIERAVPHGRTDNGGKADRGAWGQLPNAIRSFWDAEGITANGAESLFGRYKRITDKHPKSLSKNTVNQLGTLGTGNHFIEVCLDKHDRVWIMLHSGSRGLGNRFGSYFIELAKKDMGSLPDKDLAYLTEGTEHFDDYVDAVHMAQDFARVNREAMMANVLTAMANSGDLPRFQARMESINCHHNYVNREEHFGESVFVTRKGAVRAGLGDMGIIPGSMGAHSYIVCGKGSAESFESCSHGAGRAMSRGKAKRMFSLEDHAKATAGIECRKDEGVLDESPGAYKPIDAVMAAQKDLVDVVHELRQVICVKG